MNKKILNIVFFSFVIIGLALLSLSIDTTETKVVKGIEVTGNLHLSPDDYINYLRIDTSKELPELNAIKSRLDKHPYIKSSKIKVEDNILLINIEEKELTAILSSERDYLVTEKLEVIPVLPNTLNINLPVISGIKVTSENLMKRLHDNDLRNALYLVESSKLLDMEFYNDLIELKVLSSNIIIASFSSKNFAAVISENDVIKKSICVYKIWKSADDNTIDNDLEYIDLRFDNLVYLGFKKNMIEKREI